MAKVRQAASVSVASAQLFRTPTIAGLAAFLRSEAPASSAAAAIPSASFSAAQRQAGVPCSANQAQMVALYHMDPNSSAYNMPEALRLRGPLDVAALQDALRALAARHEILRTQLLERDGHVLQSVLPVEHARALPTLLRQSVRGQGGERAARILIAQEANRPFQLMGEVPLRLVLVELAVDDHVLLTVMHHIMRCGAACAYYFPSLTVPSLVQRSAPC
jgi:hypothetical protein